MMSTNNILKTVLSLVALGLAFTAEAQVTKQVEVTKAYLPEVADAVKLPMQPNMVDTVKMRPEIDYSITPQMYATDLSAHKFKPATVTYWEFNAMNNFYAKVGAGYPLNSIGDIYASAYKARVGYIMAYLNHFGEYGKRRNNQNKLTNAMQMQNHVGVAGGLYCGKRVFEGDINYKSDIYHRYAGDGSEIDFEGVNLKLRFGDNFTDLSRANFDITLLGNYFNDKAGWLADTQRRLQEAQVGVRARVARAFKRHYIEFGAAYDGRWGFKDLDGEADNAFRVGVKYGYKSDVFDLLLGAEYYNEKLKDAPKAINRILPTAKLRFNISPRDIIVPFLEVESTTENNGYYDMIRRNPYMFTNFTTPNTINYDIRLGIEGRMAKDKLAYRLYAGELFIENSIYWLNYNYMNLEPYSAKRNVLSLNFELEYKPIRRLEILAGVHGYIYNSNVKIMVDGGPSPSLKSGRAPFDAYLKVRYDFGKVSVGASSDFCGKREWNSFVTEESKPVFVAPFYADVRLDVDWQVSKMCTLFAEGRNLANMKIYQWAWYRDLGIHFTVGARVNF